jgi:hypothetical protein
VSYARFKLALIITLAVGNVALRSAFLINHFS